VYRSSTPGFTAGPATKIGTATATSYTDTAAAGTYYYQVTAQDAAGNIGPASNEAAAVVSPASQSSPSLDKKVTTHQGTNATSISSPALTTAGPNEKLVAFIASDGGSSAQTITSVSGGGLAWTFRQRANAQGGTAEIWTATATSALSGAVITATRASGSYGGSITVAAFTGADLATSGGVASSSAATGAPSVSLVTTRANSLVWAVGNDYLNAIARTVGANQTKVDEFLSPAGDTYWVQSVNAVVPAAGTTVTLNDTAPTTDRYELSAIEILAAP
jgi:hypothetical protein